MHLDFTRIRSIISRPSSDPTMLRTVNNSFAKYSSPSPAFAWSHPIGICSFNPPTHPLPICMDPISGKISNQKAPREADDRRQNFDGTFCIILQSRGFWAFQCKSLIKLRPTRTVFVSNVLHQVCASADKLSNHKTFWLNLSASLGNFEKNIWDERGLTK